MLIQDYIFIGCTFYLHVSTTFSNCYFFNCKIYYNDSEFHRIKDCTISGLIMEPMEKGMYTSSTVPTDTQRINFWASLIPGYSGMLRNARKKAKRHYAAERGLKPYQITEERLPKMESIKMENMFPTVVNKQAEEYIYWSSPKNCGYSLDSCNTVTSCSNNGETDMNTDNFATERRALTDQLYSIFLQKQDDLQEAFGLANGKPPRTPKEAVERIKAGKYVLDEVDDEDDYYYGSWSCGIFWRDPAVKKDRDGYDAANKLLNKAYEKTKLLCKVKTPDEGLAALEAFESQTFH